MKQKIGRGGHSWLSEEKREAGKVREKEEVVRQTRKGRRSRAGNRDNRDRGG